MKVGITRKVLNSLLPKPYYQTKLGKLYHGDCLEIIPQLEPVDLVFSSPPYLQQRQYENDFNWFDVVPKVFSQVSSDQVLVNIGIVHNDGQVVTYWDSLVNEMKEKGWRLFGWYIWDQGSGLPGDWNGRFAPSHEFLFHFNKRSCDLVKFVPCSSVNRTIHGTGLRGKTGKTAGKFSQHGKFVNKFKIPDSVVRITREMRRNIDHPAMFPVGLPKYIVNAFPCESVLDPFLGSGTTAVACEQLNRRWIGIEISEKYCEIAAKRIEQESKRSSMRLSNRKTKSSMKKLRKE